MNIQDEMQKIHHQYGVSEMANYKIQLFIEDLIKKDRAEQLNIAVVSKRSELLIAFMLYLKKRSIVTTKTDNIKSRVNLFLKSNL